MSFFVMKRVSVASAGPGHSSDLSAMFLVSFLLTKSKVMRIFTAFPSCDLAAVW